MKLIVVAMKDEIKDFLSNDFEEVVFKPYQLFKKGDILVLITGVGKVNAAFSLTSVLDKYKKIDLIINVGFAGATKPFKVGEVIGILSATYHDFDLTVFGYAHGQVPNLPVYYESDMTLKNKILAKYPFKEANLYTGDYFMSGANLRKGFVVDMEGAALYQVAHLSSLPIIGFKIVSDIINDNDQLDSYKAFESDLGAAKIKLVLDNVLKEV